MIENPYKRKKKHEKPKPEVEKYSLVPKFYEEVLTQWTFLIKKKAISTSNKVFLIIFENFILQQR